MRSLRTNHNGLKSKQITSPEGGTFSFLTITIFSVIIVMVILFVVNVRKTGPGAEKDKDNSVPRPGEGDDKAEESTNDGGNVQNGNGQSPVPDMNNGSSGHTGHTLEEQFSLLQAMDNSFQATKTQLLDDGGVYYEYDTNGLDALIRHIGSSRTALITVDYLEKFHFPKARVSVRKPHRNRTVANNSRYFTGLNSYEIAQFGTQPLELHLEVWAEVRRLIREGIIPLDKTDVTRKIFRGHLTKTDDQGVLFVRHKMHAFLSENVVVASTDSIDALLAHVYTWIQGMSIDQIKLATLEDRNPGLSGHWNLNDPGGSYNDSDGLESTETAWCDLFGLLVKIMPYYYWIAEVLTQLGHDFTKSGYVISLNPIKERGSINNIRLFRRTDEMGAEPRKLKILSEGDSDSTFIKTVLCYKQDVDSLRVESAYMADSIIKLGWKSPFAPVLALLLRVVTGGFSHDIGSTGFVLGTTDIKKSRSLVIRLTKEAIQYAAVLALLSSGSFIGLSKEGTRKIDLPSAGHIPVLIKNLHAARVNLSEYYLYDIML